MHKMPHPTFNIKDIENLENPHYEPVHLRDYVAKNICLSMRFGLNTLTSYDPHNMTESKWLNRTLFLETIAGIPGMVGGVIRHMKSIRTLERDNGWINHLLQEAENERMHLFIFLKLKNPGIFFRTCVILTQGVFFNLFFM